MRKSITGVKIYEAYGISEYEISAHEDGMEDEVLIINDTTCHEVKRTSNL